MFRIEDEPHTPHCEAGPNGHRVREASIGEVCCEEYRRWASCSQCRGAGVVPNFGGPIGLSAGQSWGICDRPRCEGAERMRKHGMR